MAKANKLYNDDPGRYTETVLWKVLSCGNIEVNSNKYYVIEIQHDPIAGDYRLYTQYGRIGSSGVYDERGPWSSRAPADTEFNKIVAAKQKGKTGDTSKYEIVETLSPTVGSPNIRGRAVENLTIDKAPDIIISRAASKFDPSVMQVLKQFAQENIHRITSTTSLSFTSAGLETALGPVTESHIARARAELSQIQTLVKEHGEGQNLLGATGKEIKLLNNKYLSLIPHTFGRKIQQSDWIIDDRKLIEEFDLLDQLEAAVKLGLKSDNTEQEAFKELDTHIEPLTDKDEYEKLVTTVNATKAHSHLSRWHVKKIYKVIIDKERNRFATLGETKFGNPGEFFHGSQNCNLLSIMLGGLIIPPHNASHVTGRMFGNGIYGANSSTKSLNYSVGGWSGRGNKFSNSFLLRVTFAMGKTYEPTRSMGSGPPAGYDSISAFAKNTSLANDEFIVYKLEQCTVTHLMEMESR
jgi:poly [ADP-ribose] polymerase